MEVPFECNLLAQLGNRCRHWSAGRVVDPTAARWPQLPQFHLNFCRHVGNAKLAACSAISGVLRETSEILHRIKVDDNRRTVRLMLTMSSALAVLSGGKHR